MFFKYETVIKGLSIMLLDDESVVFDYGGAHKIAVRLQRRPTEEWITYQLDQDIICLATSEREPSPRIHSMFESLAQTVLPSGSTPDRGESGFRKPSYLDESGKIRENHRIPLGDLPQPFQSFVDQLHEALHDHAIRTVRVLRWRHGQAGHHNPVKHAGSFKWS